MKKRNFDRLHFSHFSFSTFVCPTEIIAFSDRIKEFRDLNTEGRLNLIIEKPTNDKIFFILVVAISVDSQFTHLGNELIDD